MSKIWILTQFFVNQFGKSVVIILSEKSNKTRLSLKECFLTLTEVKEFKNFFDINRSQKFQISFKKKHKIAILKNPS